MTDANKPSRASVEKDHTELLLASAGPAPRLNDLERQRILQTLKSEARTWRAKRSGTRYGYWLAAAAALAVLFFWPRGGGVPVTWAQVAGNLLHVKSVVAQSRSFEMVDGERRLVSVDRLYFKDPGLSRMERFPVHVRNGALGEAEEIHVTQRLPSEARSMVLRPAEQEVTLVTHRFQGSLAQRRPLLNLAEESWRRLSLLASTSARELGIREVDGQELVGFEAPVADFLGPDEPAPRHGKLEIWVETESAWPQEIVLSFLSPEGQQMKTILSEIQWGAWIPQELLEIAPPRAWHVERLQRTLLGGQGLRLASSVFLDIAPQGAPSLVAEDDVLEVVEAEYLEFGDRIVPASLVLRLRLTPEAMARLRGFETEYPGEILVADFNGQVRGVPGLKNRDPDVVELDLTTLHTSLNEFEGTYLAPVEDLQEGSWNRP